VSVCSHEEQLWTAQDALEALDREVQESINNLLGAQTIFAFFGKASSSKEFLSGRDHVLVVCCLGLFLHCCADDLHGSWDADVELLSKLGLKIVPRRLTDPEVTAIYSMEDLLQVFGGPSCDQMFGMLGHMVQRRMLSPARECKLLFRYAELVGRAIPLSPFSQAEPVDRLVVSKRNPSKPLQFLVDFCQPGLHRRQLMH
jgi:hypothetical protein